MFIFLTDKSFEFLITFEDAVLHGRSIELDDSLIVVKIIFVLKSSNF